MCVVASGGGAHRPAAFPSRGGGLFSLSSITGIETVLDPANRVQRPVSLIVLMCALLFLAGPATGCGGDGGCRTDHDCDDEYVCEPDGCVQFCEDDADCPATHRCVQRRIEEGKICVES